MEIKWCKYCNTIDCNKSNWGLSASKCVPPITLRDKRVFKIVQEMYESSFQKPVLLEGIVSSYFRTTLTTPPNAPALNANALLTPFAFYLHRAIGADRVYSAPTQLLREAFCRLLVFRAAMHFAPRFLGLSTYVRSPHLCPVDRFFDAFVVLVNDCQEVDFYRTEGLLLYAMLALHHDSNCWVKDELDLLPAFNHFQSEVFSTTKSFRSGKVMDIFYSVKRIVREVGADTLLAPVDFNLALSQPEVHSLATVLYALPI